MAEALADLRWHVTRPAALQMDAPTKTVRRRRAAGGGGGRPSWGSRSMNAGVAADEAFGGRSGPSGADELVTATVAAFHSDESAARHYLAQLVESDDRPGIQGITAPERSAVVPDLRLVDSYDAPITRTRVLRFEQVHQAVPVFGTRAIVELDETRTAVSVSGHFVERIGTSIAATLSPAGALDRIVRLRKLDSAQARALAAPTLTLFRRKAGQACRLVYLFSDVPAGFHPRTKDHGLAPSPRSVTPRLNVMIDANSGRLVFKYGASPSASDVPIECEGEDEFGITRTFYGDRSGTAIELRDRQNHVVTFDMAFADVDRAEPLKEPVTNATSDWGQAARAAVSAHVNGWRVMEFYDSVLQRDGIDGKNMPLISVVNCLYRAEGDSRDWKNAFWSGDRMVYGQAIDPAWKRLASYSRFLDVIAHELTHGVTKYSARLVYEGESGALNESFSDILGVIIKNWDASDDGGGSVHGWDWEIGSGLGRGGLPLRDLSDPRRTGDPSAMSEFVHTERDNGGVHTNSNIHNKAAHSVLTAKGPDRKPVFTPRQVANHYYQTLRRLTPIATFHDTRLELIDVVASANAGNARRLSQRIRAVEASYDDVGIV